LRHILHASCQHHRRFTKQQPLRRLHDRFNAAAAQAIYRHRRRLHFQSRFQTNMPRSINRIGAGLQHIPEDDVIEIAGIHSRALNRGL
jgi:hypothetical protein